MGRLIGVFGCAGFGREVMSLVRAQVSRTSPDDEIVFVDKSNARPVNGVPVIGEDDFLSSDTDRCFTIAIADCAVRKRLHSVAVESGAEPMEVRSMSAEVLDAVEIGIGAILCGHSSITCNTKIGAGFQLNISSYLAHDCRVGDFVTLGPNVVCAGNVIIEDCAYIGGGALVRQGTANQPVTIGRGAVVGMGAVVTGDVAPGAVMVGNPARPLQRDDRDVK